MGQRIGESAGRRIGLAVKSRSGASARLLRAAVVRCGGSLRRPFGRQLRGGGPMRLVSPVLRCGYSVRLGSGAAMRQPVKPAPPNLKPRLSGLKAASGRSITLRFRCLPMGPAVRDAGWGPCDDRALESSFIGEAAPLRIPWRRRGARNRAPRRHNSGASAAPRRRSVPGLPARHRTPRVDRSRPDPTAPDPTRPFPPRPDRSRPDPTAPVPRPDGSGENAGTSGFPTFVTTAPLSVTTGTRLLSDGSRAITVRFHRSTSQPSCGTVVL